MLSNEYMCGLHIYYWQPGKKMSFDKSLQIHDKSWKIILNPEKSGFFPRVKDQKLEDKKQVKLYS